MRHYVAETRNLRAREHGAELEEQTQQLLNEMMTVAALDRDEELDAQVRNISPSVRSFAAATGLMMQITPSPRRADTENGTCSGAQGHFDAGACPSQMCFSKAVGRLWATWLIRLTCVCTHRA